MRTRSLLLALAALPVALAGQEHRHAGAERLGTVHFPTSCRADVGPAFDRSVALLHSFEFGAAIAGFQSVVAADSGCAMAQWGIAMARWGNPMAAGLRGAPQLSVGRAAALAATRLAATATPRERGYGDAVARLYDDYEHVDQRTRIVAYERAMAALVEAAPADTEAMIFHALALVAASPPTDKTYEGQRRAGAVLESLWVRLPDHPGLAHYIIHAYDVPALAPQAAAAAARYAAIAPSAAHAQHMPSHTFTRLGLWRESIDANLASRDLALRDSAIAEALHASDYLTYAYLQLRREADARAVVDGLPALAARFDPTRVTGAAPGSAGIFALAAIPARWTLERRAWREAAALAPASTSVPWADAMTWFARALGAAHLGRLAAADSAVAALAAIEQRLTRQGEAYGGEQVAIERLAASAWVALARGHADTALARMREAATREDATEKNAVTPGPLAPARELLGDMLLEQRRPIAALAEYRAVLKKEPNRFRTTEGAMRAARAAGDERAARGYEAQLRALTREASRVAQARVRRAP